MTSLVRDPLKVVNGNNVPITSKLKQPTKVQLSSQVVDRSGDIVMQENLPEVVSNPTNVNASSLKRKQEELAESVKQRKALKGNANPLNTTMTASSSSRMKTNLNATMDASTLRNKLSTSSKVSVPSKTTKTVTKPPITRPPKPLDLNTRLANSEKEIVSMKGLLNTTKGDYESILKQLSEKESQVVHISQVKSNLENETSAHRVELQQVYTEKLELQNQIVHLTNEHNHQLQSLQYKHTSLESLQQQTSMQLNMSRAESETLKITISTQMGTINAIKSELEAVKANLQSAVQLNNERQRKIESLEITVDEKNANVARLEELRQEDENLRRKLHNTIQELKGNIRVFCRIRPFLGAEVKEFSNNAESQFFEFPSNSDKSLSISSTSLSGVSGKDNSKKFDFSFDKVFQPGCSQSSVFAEISQLVQSALDGYNTCIFAYGQTGSGKTYTMEGVGIQQEIDMPIVDQESKGMIPRAVEQIFLSAEGLRGKGWTYEMEAMFVEIYNESIRDLLSSTKVTDETKYEIKHDLKGNTSITNVNCVKVRTPFQVYQLLARASQNRAVGRTEMNERSSRSHSVFRLKLSGSNSLTGEKNNGLLNLIDLAGSERLDQSGAQGQRLKETQNINKSLSHLGDVIAAIASKDQHIPYRNSKLTYLLQNSLGGNSKTLMFVNISPRPTDLNETVSSLRFATKVNACEIGTAKKSVKMDLKA